MTVIGSNALAGASGQAGGGDYEIERSLRFNNPDTPYLNRAPSSAGSRTTWTWSSWVKLSSIPTGNQNLFSSLGTTGNQFYAHFNTASKLVISDYEAYVYTRAELTSTRVFRDFSAWYHLVIVMDSSQATAADRVKLYVNGVQETLAGTQPNQNTEAFWNNANAHYIGRPPNNTTDIFNGYLADVYFIDGSALDPTSFGEIDNNNVWQPKKYSGSYGTNGFHLDFSDNSSNSALGTDSSGNGNNFTVNNLTAATGAATTVINADLKSTPFTDSSSNNLSLTNNGSIVTAAAGTNSFNITNAASFGSDGDSIRCSTSITVPTNYTIDYYYKTTSASQVSNATVIDSGGEVFLRDYGTATSRTCRLNNGSYQDTNYTITQGTWNHIRISNSGIWLNGTSIQSSPINIAGRSSTFTIGNYATSSSYYLTGMIGPVRIIAADLGAPASGGEPTTSGSLIDSVNVSTGADNDSYRDSPTNGDPTNDTGAGGEVSGCYCTWNPLVITTNNSLANGNLEASHAASTSWTGGLYTGYAMNVGNMGVTSGKYYWEGVFTSGSVGCVGVVNKPQGQLYYVGYADTNAKSAGFSSTYVYNNGFGSAVGSLPTISQGDIIGVAIDMDNGKLYISLNGTYVNSGDPAAGTGNVASGLNGETIFPAVSQISAAGGYSFTANFGQRSFAHTAPSGYKALCTANLPDPTIADGSTAFDAKLWTGNGSSQGITGYSFSPDLAWIKGRSNARDNALFDTVRGVEKYLVANSTAAESTSSSTLTAFNSDGFTLGGQSRTNANNETYVGWAWDAGSSNTTVAVGDYNSQLYNTSQTWSTYGTFDNNHGSASYHWPGVFNTGNYYTGGQCMYNGSSTVADTWTLSSPISVSNNVEIRTWGTTAVTLNLGLSDATSATSTGGSTHHHLTIPFTGNLASVSAYGQCYLCAIYVDGKQLVDPNLTVNFTGAPGIASTIRANPSAGISIVSYSGDSSNTSIAHGLNSPPEFAIFKARNGSNHWAVYHKEIGNARKVNLNLADAQSGPNDTLFRFADPTSSLMFIGSESSVNWSGYDMIAYLFAGVDGFSKFGKYTGNGSSDGTFIYLGFRPAFLIIKSIDTAQYWYLADSSRSSTNDGATEGLWANTNDSEFSYDVDFLSNGIKHRNTSANLNAANTFIYAAFAEHPFKTARAR